MATAKTKTIKNNKSINLDKPLELEKSSSLVKNLRGQILQARLKAKEERDQLEKQNQEMQATISKLRKQFDIASKESDNSKTKKEIGVLSENSDNLKVQINVPLKNSNHSETDNLSTWQFFKKNFLTIRFLVSFIFLFFITESIKYWSNSSKWFNISTFWDFIGRQLKTFWNWIAKVRINVPKGD